MPVSSAVAGCDRYCAPALFTASCPAVPLVTTTPCLGQRAVGGMAAKRLPAGAQPCNFKNSKISTAKVTDVPDKSTAFWFLHIARLYHVAWGCPGGDGELPVMHMITPLCCMRYVDAWGTSVAPHAGVRWIQALSTGMHTAIYIYMLFASTYFCLYSTP